jgi:predicted acetyltransferase
MLKLLAATQIDEKEYWDYIDEWKNHAEQIVPSSVNPRDRPFQQWLDDIIAMQKPETLPANRIVADTYFLSDAEARLLGAVNIRHTLNEYLYNFGGHIGYGVRPSERKKGYATMIVRLALEKCRELGLDRVLITCATDNTASAHTIIANGGVLENETVEDGRPTLRFWIEL